MGLPMRPRPMNPMSEDMAGRISKTGEAARSNSPKSRNFCDLRAPDKRIPVVLPYNVVKGAAAADLSRRSCAEADVREIHRTSQAGVVFCQL